MASILVRATIIYIVFVGMIRFSGKRQVGQMQISELITGFLLSNIASYPITNASVPLLYAIVPIIVILSLEIISSFLTMKCPAIKSLFENKPSIVVRGGVPDQKELEKIRMNAEDLFCQIRLKDTASPEQLDYAIFEQNGQLSVFPKQNAPQISGIAHPLVIDGNFVKHALKESGKSREWTLQKLSSLGITDIKSVFIMTVDDADYVSVVRKDGR